MMLSDAPRYVDHKAPAPDRQAQTAEDEAGEIVGFFRSKLSD